MPVRIELADMNDVLGGPRIISSGSVKRQTWVMFNEELWNTYSHCYVTYGVQHQDVDCSDLEAS